MSTEELRESPTIGDDVNQHEVLVETPTPVMATVAFGKLEEFDGSKEEWNSYIERLEFYFEANGISEDTDNNGARRRAILLTCVGATTYKVIRSLCSPDKPNEKTYADIKTLMEDHQHPVPNVIAERFRFNSRN